MVRETKARMEVDRLLKEVERGIRETKIEIQKAESHPTAAFEQGGSKTPPLSRTVDRNMFYIIYHNATDVSTKLAPAVRTWASGQCIADRAKDFIFDVCGADDDELEYESRVERLRSSTPLFSSKRRENYFLVQLGRCLLKPVVVESQWRKLMAAYEPITWVHVIDVLDWVALVSASRKLQRWFRRARVGFSLRRERSSFAPYNGHWAIAWNCRKLSKFLERTARVDANDVRAQEISGKEFLRMIFDPAFKRAFHSVVRSAIHRTRLVRMFASRRPPQSEGGKRRWKRSRGVGGGEGGGKKVTCVI